MLENMLKFAEAVSGGGEAEARVCLSTVPAFN